MAAPSIIGAFVGLEREVHRQVGGRRTNALVAAGAALFIMVGADAMQSLATAPRADPMRVAAQIVPGIGFIGAEAILREGGAVRGVTTAAALSTSAALGMAAGSGPYATAAAGLVVGLTALIGLRQLRERGWAGLRQQRAVHASYHRGHGTLAPIIDALERAGVGLEGLHIDDGDEPRRVRLDVRTRDADRLDSEIAALANHPEITDICTTGARART
jgi:putative Mg2+ transporter-C (MgtC) family protein